MASDEEYKGSPRIDHIAEGIDSGKYSNRKLPKEIYHFNARKLVDGIYSGYKKKLTKINYNDSDLKLLKHLRENIYIFSAAKTFQQTQEMTSALKDGSRIVPLKEFKERVGKISKEYNKNWLEAEYDTAISQAQSASAWERFEEQKTTLSLLRYSTIGDACSICAPLNDLTAPVGDPIWSTKMPPNHFRCKCIVEQEDSEEVKQTPVRRRDKISEQVSEQMDKVFMDNPGKTGEAFNKHHPYFSVPKQYTEFAKTNFGLEIPEVDGNN